MKDYQFEFLLSNAKKAQADYLMAQIVAIVDGTLPDATVAGGCWEARVVDFGDDWDKAANTAWEAMNEMERISAKNALTLGDLMMRGKPMTFDKEAADVD